MKNFLNTDLNCSDIVYNDINYYQANMMMGFKYPKSFLKSFRKQLRAGGNLYHPGLKDSINNEAVLDAHYRSVFDTFKAKFLSVQVNQSGALTRVNWEDAVMYAFCLSHSVKGIPLKSYLYKHPTFSKAKFLIVMKHLRHHIEQRKFKSVQYFTGDAMNLIKQQDSEESFFVVDPGYMDMEHYYRNGGKKGPSQKVGKKVVKRLSDDKMHVSLSQTLKGIKGKFMLCYYYHPKLEKLYPRDRFTWVMKEYRRPAASSSAAKKDELGTELLIMNYGGELGERTAYKQHLVDSAKAVMPKGEGRRNRASYSIEFKHRVALILESGLFKKKEVLEFFGIKSYNTLSKWLLEKSQLEATLVRIKETKDYLHDNRKKSNAKANGKTGCNLVPERARNLIADLRHQGILSNKAIRGMFGISSALVEDCYAEWRERRVAVPFKTKLARYLTYWHKMAA